MRNGGYSCSAPEENYSGGKPPGTVRVLVGKPSLTDESLSLSGFVFRL